MSLAPLTISGRLDEPFINSNCCFAVRLPRSNPSDSSFFSCCSMSVSALLICS
ncbi:GSCOCG00008131001-RA-CDS [Cotesia congregata]|nr:GSCOCG00008131001-RA-CDS [Cotesia congregata]